MSEYKSYAEYLQTPEFLRVRGEVMRRSRGHCECDTDGPCHRSATEVHHLRYPAWGTFDTPDNLIAVCHECHERLHTCDSCGGKLKSEAIKAGRSECFDCYAKNQD